MREIEIKAHVSNPERVKALFVSHLGEGKTVVTILPDTAERYFSTPLFDE